MSEFFDFFEQEVFPYLDAVDAGFLNNLNPKLSKGSKVSYSLDCPSCNARGRAFYYPGSAFIVCNRRENCGSTGLWSFLKDQGHSGADIRDMLCAAVGKSPPSSDKQNPSGKTNQYKLVSAVKKLLIAELWANPKAVDYLTNERKLSKSDITKLELGFYSSEAKIRATISDMNLDMGLAGELGYINTNPQSPFELTNRVVGFWDAPNGDMRLWGRTLGDDGRKKYHYSSGLSKDMPYGFKSTGKMLVAVEGVFDRASLFLTGIPSVAVGGNCITNGQASFLAEKRIQDLLFITDAGEAAIKGALTTIAVCEPLGINTYFAAIKESGDDIDQLRIDGKTEVIHDYVNDSLSGGEYLAAYLLRMLEKKAVEGNADWRRIERLIPILGAQSRLRFDAAVKRLGLTIPSIEQKSVRLFGDLCDGGLSIKEAAQIVESRFNVTIDIGHKEDGSITRRGSKA